MILGYQQLLLKKKLLINNKFNNLRTKEDYFLWLKIAKKTKFIYGLSKYLSSWRKTKNSLSSSVYQKLLDAFKLYRIYLKKDIVTSIIMSIRLSFYAVNKKFLVFINRNK